MRTKDLGKVVSHIRTKNPERFVKVSKNLHRFSRLMEAENYKGIRNFFGKKVCDTMIDYFCELEDYDTCIKIRDCKKEKTPI